VSVSYETTVRDWKITVSGRIDGLSVDPEKGLVTIEEVKSLHFDLELDALYRSEKLQRHLYQLLLYAFFLRAAETYREFDFHPQLVLVDLVSGETRLIDAEFDAGSVASTLTSSLESLVDEIETAEALRAAKRAFAETLEFPYERMRPYQQEMIDAVGREGADAPRRCGTPVVADDVRARNAQRVEDADDVDGEHRQRVRVDLGRLATRSVAAHVGNDRLVAGVDERRDNLRPQALGVGEAVDQHHGPAGAFDLHVERHTVGLDLHSRSPIARVRRARHASARRPARRAIRRRAR
jgi:hypothetical protein